MSKIKSRSSSPGFNPMHRVYEYLTALKINLNSRLAKRKTTVVDVFFLLESLQKNIKLVLK